jgi:hypothetical protein
MTDQSQIREAILAVIDDPGEQACFRRPFESAGQAVLFGPDGVLDSLGLVRFVVAVEQKISEVFGVHLTLASDQAMSRQHSPFHTVDSMVCYVAELLKLAEMTGV